jgi:hypothetical protein
MNVSLLSKLSTNDHKILNYLFVLSLKNLKFSFDKMKSLLSISDQEIYTSLKILWDLEIIDVSYLKESDIFISFNSKSFNMNITDLSKTSIRLLNSHLICDQEIIDILIVELYTPLGLYDGDCMNYNTNINKQILIPPKQVLSEEQINKKLQRQKDRRKAQSVLEYFYSVMNSLYGTVLNSRQRKYEDNNALSFVKSYGDYNMEVIKSGIDWLLNDGYWKKYVTNIGALNRHFIKYLTNNNITLESKEEQGIKFI